MYLPESETVLITEAHADQRVDRVLSELFPEVSRTYFQWLIRNGYVQLNNQTFKKRRKLLPGDVLKIRFVMAPVLSLEPEPIPLDVLYEDEWLIAVNKPRGMVVHPGVGNWSSTFVNALLFHCQELEHSRNDVRPGIVHRLDKDTSGILIAAKQQQAQQRLQAQFAGRSISKVYLAICVGKPGEAEIRTRIARHPVKRKQMACVETGGREAITHCTTLASDDKISLVRLTPVTGRTHQLRVHMAHRRTPILGDPLYGNTSWNHKYERYEQQLHAYTLAFHHPMEQRMVTLRAPLPRDMTGVIGNAFPTILDSFS